MSTNAFELSRLLIIERPSLLRLARRIAGSESAEDVVQKVWLKIQGVRDDPPILDGKAYLHRLASNLAIDVIRSEQRRRDVHAEAMAFLHAGMEGVSGERTVLARNELAHIGSVIAALPDPTRRIFTMSRLEGLAQREIAERLGLSRRTVEKHLRRAFDAVVAARTAEQ